MKLNTIVRFLNKELNINKIKDSSRNGLQIRIKNDIKKIGFAVDGCLSTFEKAKKAKVDLLIVHHGIKWKPQKYQLINKKREDFLKKNKISLYAAHLPLDVNYKYGNNVGLCNIFGLINIKRFGRYHGFKVGYKGSFKKVMNITQISNMLNKKLKTKCRIFPFGNKQIKTVGIVSGSGADVIEDIIKERLDCFLVGEIKLSDYHRARDSNLNVVVAGHYATETVGIKSLQSLLKQKFKVETTFIENKVDL